MFELNANNLLLIVFASVAVGGVLYVFVYPLLSGEAKADKRKAVFMEAGARKTGERQTDANARRKQLPIASRRSKRATSVRRCRLRRRLPRPDCPGAASSSSSTRR
jgi:tight adherence protein B